MRYSYTNGHWHSYLFIYEFFWSIPYIYILKYHFFSLYSGLLMISFLNLICYDLQFASYYMLVIFAYITRYFKFAWQKRLLKVAKSNCSIYFFYLYYNFVLESFDIYTSKIWYYIFVVSKTCSINCYETKHVF